MRSKHLLLIVLWVFLVPVGIGVAAPIDEVKAAVEKGEKVARRAKRGSLKRRSTNAMRALEQFAYALRAMKSADLMQSSPELVDKVRGAIAELNGYEHVKDMKMETRAQFVTALEEGRSEDAVTLLERLLTIDARDAGVEQALFSLREGLGQGSKP